MSPQFIPRAIADVSPEEFEKVVRQLLAADGAPLPEFSATHRETIEGDSGAFEIDIVCRFKAFHSDFVVLVECKKHRSFVKREHIQLLRDRVLAVGAHKGIFFTTTGYQSGAVKYAERHGIELFLLADTEPVQTGQPGGTPEFDTSSSTATDSSLAVRPTRRRVCQPTTAACAPMSGTNCCGPACAPSDRIYCGPSSFCAPQNFWEATVGPSEATAMPWTSVDTGSTRVLLQSTRIDRSPALLRATDYFEPKTYVRQLTERFSIGNHSGPQTIQG